MKKATWALFAAILLLCGGAMGTDIDKRPAPGRPSDTNIVGHVVDARNGEHIPYVSITLRGTTIGAMTDATGHYLLKNLPENGFTIVASCVGYRTQELPATTRSGETVEINFTLQSADIELDQIVVSSSRTEENRRTAPVIVNIVSDKTFAATNSTTPAEALNYQPGLRTEYDCMNCGVPQLRINGLEGQYSQILLDSRPIFSSLATVYGLEQLPAGMIERVEVVRGGASALYGSNAIGGVVNIITREPQRSTLTINNMLSVLKGGRTDMNTSLNGALTSEDYRAGAYLFANVRNRQSYDRDGDGFSEIPVLKGETAGFRGYYKTGAYSKLTAEYHHIHEYRRGGNRLDRQPFESDVAEQLEHYIDGGGLNFDLNSADYRHRLTAYASAQYIDRKSYFGGGHDLNAYGTTTDRTLVGGAQYSYSFDRLLFSPAQLTAGAEYNNDLLRDAMPGYNRDIDQLVWTGGGFVQNEWKSERLNLVVGARLDKNNLIDGAVFCPRANFRYTPSEHLILRGGYSSGYRAPQAYNEDLHVAAVGGNVAIISLAPGLKPEYSDSFTASGDVYFRLGKWHVNLLAEGFYTQLTDVFALKENGRDADGNLLMQRVNASGAVVAGVNMEAKLAVGDPFSLQMGFTVQRSRYDDPFAWSEDPSVAPVREMLRSPDNYGYFVLSSVPFERFGVALSGTYTGSMLVPHMAGAIPSDQLTSTRQFFDAGFRFSYDIPLSSCTMQLSAGMKNVLDQYQPDLDRGALRDAGYIYGPALPRTFVFGVKFTL